MGSRGDFAGDSKAEANHEESVKGYGKGGGGDFVKNKDLDIKFDEEGNAFLDATVSGDDPDMVNAYVEKMDGHKINLSVDEKSVTLTLNVSAYEGNGIGAFHIFNKANAMHFWNSAFKAGKCHYACAKTGFSFMYFSSTKFATHFKHETLHVLGFQHNHMTKSQTTIKGGAKKLFHE